MFEFSNFTININFSTPVFLIAVVLLILITFYNYRTTLPEINKSKKILLSLLRFFALFLLIISLFEPKLNYSKSVLQQNKNLIFFDNSKSILSADSLQIQNTISSLSELIKDENLQFEVFSFSDKIDSLKNLDIEFSGTSTNAEKILQYLEENDNISSATLISDGIFNSGNTSFNKIENLNTPLFTVGIGDSTKANDVKIKQINFNSFVYVNKNTQIEVLLETTKPGEEHTVLMTSSNQRITKRIKTSENLNKVVFDYKPTTEGKQKISISVSNLKNEVNTKNNKAASTINVLNNKNVITLISESLSADYRFIKNILKADSTIETQELLKLNNNEKLNLTNLNNSKAVYMIGFPSDLTTNSEIVKFKDVIQKNNISLFLILSPGTNLQKLKQLNEILIFDFEVANENKNLLVSAEPERLNNPIIKNEITDLNSVWKNLPPVIQPEIRISKKTGIENLVSSVNNNVKVNPLILSGKSNNIKMISVLASSVWKWQLNKSENVLEKFINSSAKWLMADENFENIIVKPSKNIFSSGEEVKFQAKVYSEIFEPVNNAEVNVEITNSSTTKKIRLTNTSEANYEGSINISETGKFNFKSEVNLGDEKLYVNSGSFEISDTELESLELTMNKNKLKEISYLSSGKYFEPDRLSDWLNEIKKISESREIIRDKNYSVIITLNKNLLFIIVFLFAVEWILRKRWQLL